MVGKNVADLTTLNILYLLARCVQANDYVDSLPRCLKGAGFLGATNNLKIKT